MAQSSFAKATKGKKPLRLVLGGVSGAGKTYTALLFCKHLESITGKRTAAVDTEHYRMSLYADKFDFDVNNWEPPFDPRELIKTIKEAEKSGYGQFIIDSSTHFYNSEGGLLEIVNDAAKTRYGGNVYAGWAVGTPIQNALIDTIIRSPLHIISCVRAKQGYLETEKNNKKTYEKSAMELLQRDQFEFDFDFSIMMDMDNNGMVEKGMGFAPPGTYFKKPDEKTIELILRSINENTTGELAVPSESKKEMFKKQEEVMTDLSKKVVELCKSLGGSKNEALMVILKEFEPSGNPNKIKDQEKLTNLLVKISELAEKKEK
jgi:hypothetical protein